MSTWTNKPCKAWGMAAGLLLLAGCLPAPMAFNSPRSAAVLDGSVKVGLPPGYCIDRRAGREVDDTAVVVMGRCRDDLAAPAALLTLAIGPQGSGGVLNGGGEALAGYFTSEAGKAALSRSGRASAVTIRQAKAVGPAFMMLIRDGNVGDYWRGVEPVAGRLITITVDLPEESTADGEALLDAALLAMRRANDTP